MEKLDLKQVMAIIRSGRWIKSICCLTADLTKNKGGEIIEYKNVRIARRQTMERRGTAVESTTGDHKDARHNFNFTINLELRNHQIRKIHPILIYEVNNLKVI